MTELLEEAIERLRELSEAEQHLAAGGLMRFLAELSTQDDQTADSKTASSRSLGKT